MTPADIVRLKKLLPTSLGSAEIRQRIAADILRRAVFSARMASASYLAKIREVCIEISEGRISQADARARMLEVLEQMGHSQQDPGGLLNPASQRRLDLIIDTQRQMAASVAMLSEETEATVYGNFWIFCYKLNGKTLETTSGGECPGVMKLAKKDGVWTVVSMEKAGEGEDYAKDIAKFCNGDKELEEQFALTTGAAEDSILPQYQRAAVVNYVQDNKLDIEAYQDYGQDPVSVTD